MPNHASLPTVNQRKIGVFIEDHFDMTEYRLLTSDFRRWFDLEYNEPLENPTLQFGSNPDNGWVEEHITVSKDVKDVNPVITRVSS